MAKNLVIVESPAKAKTIEGFLGTDFLVKSSFGHVRDLAKKDISVDVENNFKPNYEVTADKKAVVTELKKLSKKAEMVWLATDEDREGEAISWHLIEALDLDEKKIKRITFNEITKPAVLSAIESPREIDVNLVDAQQARRILDRLVGFELSPVLWKKVKPSLSAGRVQSVAVRVLVERERQIDDFKSVASFKVTANFLVGGKSVLKADLSKKFGTQEEAQAFLERCQGANYSIKDLVVKPGKKSPAAPFTTSTLQQEASRKLGFSVARTMIVAQRLYEAGKITYMRTDSVNLSDTALTAAKDEIIGNYGADYANPKKYVTKAKGAQEAHEAIRPSYMNVHTAGTDASEERLYELIWKRTIASQMTDALLEKTTATIAVSTTEEHFVAQGEVLKFDGFLKVYLESTDDDQEESQKGMLPPLAVGEDLNLREITAVQRFTHHPARYTEASLVKKLEELGIGRPSTYAPTISTIQKRGYVVKEDRDGKERKYEVLTLKNDEINHETRTERTGVEKAKMFPTDIGMVVNDFLVEHFDTIMDYNFTASVEKEFDDIAHGLMQWTEMIGKFYSPFHKGVEVTLETSERATGERELGTDPESGKPIIVRIGRFGPMVQIGSQDDEEKPRFASLLKNQSIAHITLEEALDLFKLPRELGMYQDQKVTVAIGKYGPYARIANEFVSLKADEGDDPMTVTLERAIELIDAKRLADKEKYIKVFDENEEVQVLKGRYGPYIKIGRKNFRIPKDVVPEDLTLEQCLKIAEEAPAKKSRKKK
jgi:DNA topoisomerase-1